MKRYNKPEVKCYDIEKTMLGESSVGITNSPASTTYEGGGDAKESFFFFIGDSEVEEE